MKFQTVLLSLVVCSFVLAPRVRAADDDKSGAAKNEIVIDKIAAVVNRDVVLQSEVDTVLEQMMQAEPLAAGADVEKARTQRRAEILDTLVAEKLMEAEVRKLHIDVTEPEIDRVVKGTMQQYKLDDEQLKLALARQGLTLDEYREGLKKQLTKMKIIQLKVKSRVQVTDQDVQSAYAQQKAIQAVEFRVKARHILFVVPPGAGDDVVSAQRKKALAAKARLDGGADFSKLAAELSDDTASKDRGGSLGEFGRGEMVPEFEHVAFTAKPGVPTEPVRTPFGWHIMLVDERVTSSAAPEHGLDDIRTRLYESEVEQAFKGYLEELRVAAHIEKRL